MTELGEKTSVQEIFTALGITKAKRLVRAFIGLKKNFLLNLFDFSLQIIYPSF